MRKKCNILARAVHTALAIGAIGSCLAAVPASAQTVTLTREDLQRTGLVSLGDILQQLTVSGPAANTGFNSGGNGETRIDLRNLGSQRTLVLVNGRRWIGNAATLDGAIDLNTIPLAIVDRVEVLLGGDSAAYGSGAIAGVINIVTRGDYEGAEASAYLGQNQEGDGRVESYDFSIGAQSEKASVSMAVGYVKQEPILAGDRAISATPIANIPGNSSNLGASTSTPFGRFFRNGSLGSVTFDPATGGYRPYNGDVDGFNIAPDNYLSTPQERTSLYVQARYQLSDEVAFRTEALYNQRRSAQQLAAPFFTLGAAFGIPISIAPGQEFNPFTQNLTRLQYRPSNDFVRRFSQDVDTFHFAGGFEGQFGLWDRDWSWDLDYSYSDNEQNDSNRNLVISEQVIAGLQPDCTVDNGCVPLDIFHGPDAFTREMANSVLYEAHDAFEYEQWSYRANLRGDVVALPAGPVKFLAGYEYRREQGFDSPDALVSSAPVRPSTRGGYAVDEAVVGFSVPILKDATFAETLLLTGAARYSDYSSFGSTTNTKVGFLWKPTQDLSVRGNWSEDFRAPSVSELFLGSSTSFESYGDPCSFDISKYIGAEARSRCVNGFAGILPVPAGYIQPVTFSAVTVGGSADLQPERAITRTLGIAYAPGWASGLNLSLDWYDIELRHAIGVSSAQNLIDRCYLAGDASACAQARLARDSSGTVTQFFAGNVNLPGGIETEGYDFNASYKLETDVGLFAWNWDTTYVAYFGELGMPDRLDCIGAPGGSSAFLSCPSGVARGNIVGTYAGYDPQWRVRSNLTSHWSWGDWGATVGIRYYSPLDEDCSTPVSLGFADLCSDPGRIVDVDGDGIGDESPQNRIGSRTYVDLQATWEAPWNGRIALGVNNAFDRDPPIAYSAPQNSFDPAYPVPGRFWYAQYTQRF